MIALFMSASSFGFSLIKSVGLKYIEILGHVVIDIFGLSFRKSVIPVGVFVEHNRKIITDSVSHLSRMEHQPVIIGNISRESRINPNPFV